MDTLEAIRSSNSDIRARVIYVLLDGFAAVEALITEKTVSSAWLVQKFRTTAAKALVPCWNKITIVILIKT